VLAREEEEGMTWLAKVGQASRLPRERVSASSALASPTRAGGKPALLCTLLFAIMLIFMGPAHAQVTFTGTTTDDAYLATGSPENSVGSDLTADNFGGAGVLAISPPGAANGEFQTVLKFGMTAATNWVIGAVSLDFASNAGTQGAQPMNGNFNTVNAGIFVIEWMAGSDWVEGTGRPIMPTMDGVTYDSLTNLLTEPHVPLCTNTYIPPGNNAHVMWPLPQSQVLVSNILAGTPVSFRLYAADNQVGYIFNSHNFGNGNQPFIHITAVPLSLLYSGGFTNGVFCLNGFGNSTYTVQACSDLSSTNWQAIGSVTANGAGVLQFGDTNSSARLGMRFYRLSQ
jgi:hypothetical protein